MRRTSKVLKDILGVQLEALNEKYLGLPTMVGRSKDGCFKHVREAARGKVTGWKGQGLSKAAREVLVKSCLQSTPTYCMSVLQLSKKMCRNLKSISSKFWSGAANGGQIVHWVAWDYLCTRKREGGMGFRDFELFNQALLAKQVWRIIMVPNSLCAQVLKAIYFQDMDIMSAPCPQGCSFTWRSLLQGRYLLAQGLVWRVGDGATINVHHSNWIPRAGSMTPLGAVFVPNLTKVADFLKV